MPFIQHVNFDRVAMEAVPVRILELCQSNLVSS